MDRCVIYGIRLRNDPSYEYRYVGLSVDPDSRFRRHIWDATNSVDIKYNYPLYRWMRKHFLAVEFDILAEYGSRSELNYAEIMWIHILKSRGHRLLNLTDGGVATLGWKPTDELKARWSNAHLGLAAGTKNGMYGRKHKDSSKELMSSKKRGKTAHNKGTAMTEEQKLKISESKKLDPGPANHTRWHVNKGKYNDKCNRCRLG